MLKHLFLSYALTTIAGLAFVGGIALAAVDGDDPVTQQEVASKSTANNTYWKTALETKYNLTAQQIQDLTSKGWNYPQITIASALAQASGKTLTDVVNMRNSGMGWGEICKQLGIPPKDIGQSIAGIRHEINAERKTAHAEKMSDKKMERLQNKADRAEARAEHAADAAAAKSGRH